PDIRGERYELGASLDADERRRWWMAAAEDGNAATPDARLADLEVAWVARKRAAAVLTPAVPSSSTRLFTALALLGRSWPETSLAELAPGSARDLIAAGAVATERGWVAITPLFESLAEAARRGAPSGERFGVAHALAHGPEF